MSPEKDLDYFCEGMAVEIINALTKLDNLRVVARTSAFQFKGQSKDIRTIGDALNVKAVLEGSVRTSGDRLRVTAQLINIADGYHLWAERYDRQMEDVFDIQDEISLAITEALKIRLVDTAVPTVDRHTEDLDAYHWFLQGRHLWFSRHGGWPEKALRCFEMAIEKDPSYPVAHAGVARVHASNGTYGFVPPKAAFPKAKAAVDRGLVAGAEVADVHTALGMIRLIFDWDWAGADDAFTRATALDPADALALGWRGISLSVVGRHSEALAAARRAQELDPLEPYIKTRVMPS